MAIPEAQLDTWCKQGATVTSASTYATIKGALEDSSAGYSGKNFSIYLQGSYGNDTNIFSESDVDVVIQLNSAFYQDISKLTQGEKELYEKSFSNAVYTYSDFKKDVEAALKKAFGVDVKVGKKAIKITASGNRRSADVIAACQYRRYLKFNGVNDQDYVEGIYFESSDGVAIKNYPKVHSKNLTAKHKDTNGMLKPMVRILKNMRSRMVDHGLLKEGIAPSYYVEGLFYNVPSEQFVSNSYGDTFCNGINWLLKADKAKLVCANWQYYLLGSSNVQWTETDFHTFLSEVCDFWKNWE